MSDYREWTTKSGDTYTEDYNIFGGCILVDGPMYQLLDSVCGNNMTAIHRFLRRTEVWSREKGTWRGQTVYGFAQWGMQYFKDIERRNPSHVAHVRI